MIRSYSLHTSEIDDPQLAADEILSQLEAVSLCRHSVGLLVCHYDYMASGVLEAVRASLPFDLIGITTFYQTGTAAEGIFELTITVMTSDDIRFAIAGSGSISETNAQQCVHDTYNHAYAVHAQTPALVLSFLSMRSPINGDAYLRALDDCSGGVLSFGAVSSGNDDTSDGCFVVYPGGITSTGFAMLLLIGDVEMQTYFANNKLDKLLGMTATVTQAQGGTVRELNGQPALSYVRKNNINLEGEDYQGIITIPFLYKLPTDQRMIGRTLCGYSEQDGLSFLGEIPEGALLRTGTITIDDILETSNGLVDEALETSRNAGVFFIFSCVGRYITLGLDPTLEMESIKKRMAGGIPYVACYVGGEICPAGDPPAQRNQYHNASIIICALA